MILIDTNALILLIVGLVDENLIKTHKRCSIYNRNNFYDLLAVIKDFKNLIVLPNVWTEVDNLLNNFSRDYKWIYIQQVITIIKESTEKYLHTKLGFENNAFWDLGLTDSLLLDIGKECDFIITSDSKLSDYALANELKV